MPSFIRESTMFIREDIIGYLKYGDEYINFFKIIKLYLGIEYILLYAVMYALKWGIILSTSSYM